MTIDKSGTDPHRTDGDDANAITPLEGEAGIPSVTQARASNLSWKGIVAVTLLLLSIVAVGTLTIHRALSSDKPPGDAESKIAANRPAAAATEPRKLDMTPAPRPVAASVPVGPPIPVVSPAAEAALAEPIGVRRTGAATGPAAGPQRVAPEDAPAVLVSSRPGPDSTARATAPPLPPGAEHSADDPLDGTKRNLEAYQRQLQGLLATLTKSTELAAPGPAPAPLSGPVRPQQPSPRRPARPAASAPFNQPAAPACSAGNFRARRRPVSQPPSSAIAA